MTDWSADEVQDYWAVYDTHPGTAATHFNTTLRKGVLIWGDRISCILDLALNSLCMILLPQLFEYSDYKHAPRDPSSSIPS